MTLVHIPFWERFEKPMISGIKTLTSRSKKYGEAGDTFEAFGQLFKILEVSLIQLGDIASFWREEGMDSLEDFVETWKKIHPRVGYRIERKYYMHRFEKVIEK